MALIEPAIAAGQRELQMDYTLANSLQNIAFGAILGGALHSTIGAVGEWRRARSGLSQMWEYIPGSAESEELMRANARLIERTRLEADPTLDAGKVASEAKADALLWDNHIRHLAYQKQITAADAYREFGYELRNGEMHHQKTQQAMERMAGLERERGELEALRDMAERNPELGIRFDERELADMGRRLDLERGYMLEAQKAAQADIAEMTGGNSLYAMHRSSANSLSEFAEGVAQKKKGFENETFISGKIFSRIDVGLTDASLEVPYFAVNHVYKGHPAFKSWNMLPILAEKGKVWKAAEDSQTGNQGWIFAGKTDESILVMIAYSKSGKHGQRLVLNTAFEASERSFDNWLKNKGAVSAYHGPGDIPGLPKPVETGRLHDLSENGNQTLFKKDASVNTRILGATTFHDDALQVIRLFASHDASTLRHELAHVIRKNMDRSARTGSGKPAAARQYAALERAFGIEDGKWTVGQEEAFAKSFERYLFDGVAPTNELVQAFNTIKDGMAEVYANADAVGIEISPEVRSLFNNMLTTPPIVGKWQFNKELARLASGEWARFDSGEIRLNQTRELTLAERERIEKAADREMEESIISLERNIQEMIDDPNSPIPMEMRSQIANVVNERLIALDEAAARVDRSDAFVRDYLACIL